MAISSTATEPGPGVGKTNGDPRRIQSIEVGFRVLRVVADAGGPMRLRDIAAAANMPTSKAHLYLVSFVREELIEQDPLTQHYRIGRFAVKLGLAALGRLGVIDLAKDELPGLRDATGCGAYVSLWGNRGPTIAMSVDGLSQGSLAIRVGYVLSLSTTATGQVFLAHKDRREWQALIAEEKAGAQPSLEGRLDEIRRRGYFMAPGTRQNPGFFAMAAPIFNFSRRIEATLTLLGSKVVLEHRSEEHLADILRAAADRISRADSVSSPNSYSAHT